MDFFLSPSYYRAIPLRAQRARERVRNRPRFYRFFLLLSLLLFFPSRRKTQDRCSFFSPSLSPLFLVHRCPPSPELTRPPKRQDGRPAADSYATGPTTEGPKSFRREGEEEEACANKIKTTQLLSPSLRPWKKASMNLLTIFGGE